MTLKRLELELKKLVKENKEKEMTLFMNKCLQAGRLEPNDNLTAADFDVLSSLIEQKLKAISRRLETLNANEMTPYQPQMQTPAPAIVPEEMALLNDGDGSNKSANGDETIIPPIGDANNPQL